MQEANAIFWRHLKFIHMLHKKRRINCAHIQASFYPQSMLFFVPTDAIPPIKARSVFCQLLPWVLAMSACSRISRHVLPLCRRVREAWVRVKVSSSLLRRRKAEPRHPDCPQLFCLKTQTLAPRAQAADDANEHLDPRLGH